MRQLWEVDLHPEEACNGPIDLHVSLEIDPRTLLSFEDVVMAMDDPEDEPQGEFTFPLVFTWAFPPLTTPPDLLVLATEVAGLGGLTLPLEVSAIDSFQKVTDAPERSLSVVGRVPVSLAHVYKGATEPMCEVLERCREVSLNLLGRVPDWIEDLDQ